MVKQAYKIPTNIHNSRLDNEIRLSTNDNSLESKPISLRSLMIYILSGFALAWTMKNTFMVHAMLPVQILFGLVWVLITYLLGRYEKTKELGLIPIHGRTRSRKMDKVAKLLFSYRWFDFLIKFRNRL